MTPVAIGLAVLGFMIAAIVVLLSIPPVCRAFMRSVGCAIDRRTERRIRWLCELAGVRTEEDMERLWYDSRDAWEAEFSQPERPA